MSARVRAATFTAPRGAAAVTDFARCDADLVTAALFNLASLIPCGTNEQAHRGSPAQGSNRASEPTHRVGAQPHRGSPAQGSNGASEPTHRVGALPKVRQWVCRLAPAPCERVAAIKHRGSVEVTLTTHPLHSWFKGIFWEKDGKIGNRHAITSRETASFHRRFFGMFREPASRSNSKYVQLLH